MYNIKYTYSCTYRYSSTVFNVNVFNAMQVSYLAVFCNQTIYFGNGTLLEIIGEQLMKIQPFVPFVLVELIGCLFVCDEWVAEKLLRTLNFSCKMKYVEIACSCYFRINYIIRNLRNTCKTYLFLQCLYDFNYVCLRNVNAFKCI
jgi:hypothetical protein